MRFVETTEAKIYRGEDLAQDARTLTVSGAAANSTEVSFPGGTVAADALAGRYVLIGGQRVKVKSNTAAKLVLEQPVTASDKAAICPGEGGRDGCAVYGCPPSR